MRVPGEGALSKHSLLKLLAADPPLVHGMPDPDLQCQSNGIDLTLCAIWRIHGPLTLGQVERVLPSRVQVDHVDGWFELTPGPYVALLNEVVSIPRTLMALSYPRSSMLRGGVEVHSAVWDAGYVGRSELMLNVVNPSGCRLERNARIAQIVFFTLDREAPAYDGAYQRQNMSVVPGVSSG
ncbi:MAG: deoxyuridine 5'-triphosphate nucleotidohydrolase [Chloroflexota bacterium]